MSQGPPRPRRHIANLPRYVAGTRAVRSDGTPGYKLASNESPYPPSTEVLAAVSEAAAGANRYPGDGSALGARLAELTGVASDRIAVGGGSLGLLRDLLTAYAGHGTEVVFGWRSYEAYPILVQSSGARGIPVPLVDQRLDPTGLLRAVGRRTRAVLLANPNNPTGTTRSGGEIEELARDLPDTCLLVLDLAYCEFASGDLEAEGLALVHRHANVVLMRTFSKAYSLAGLRIGWAVADPEIVATLKLVALPFGLTALAEAAALSALGQEAEMERRVQGTVAERTRVLAELGALGYRVPPSETNFFWLPLGAAAQKFAGDCSAAGISVRCFSGEGVRVTVGTRAENDALLEVARLRHPPA